MLPEADYWVGIEGGVEDENDEMAAEKSTAMAAFAWVVVRSGDRVGKARTGTFFLPAPVADLVRQGKELGEADDIIFGRSNSKQENGAIGLLTGNVIDRTQLYEHAVVLALVPFKNVGLYSAGTSEVSAACPQGMAYHLLGNRCKTSEIWMGGSSLVPILPEGSSAVEATLAQLGPLPMTRGRQARTSGRVTEPCVAGS